ncbi:MAG: hypothetical protein H0V43_13255 [Gemmatimonadales bacterium]|nr:hypothetical protein [Gemmatimonadales bacterium]
MNTWESAVLVAQMSLCRARFRRVSVAHHPLGRDVSPTILRADDRRQLDASG